MSYRTDTEILLGQQIDLIRIEKGIKEFGEDWQYFLDDLPGFIHLNQKDKILVKFINKRGIEETGFTNKEINEIGYEYQKNYLDDYTLAYSQKYLVPFIIEDDENKIFSFSQRFRKREDKNFKPIYTVTKPLRNSNLLLSYSLSTKHLENLSSKMQRLLREDYFVHKHFQEFKSLSKREVEVLTLLAKGFPNKEISESLAITTETVKQHRKKIKHKTGCRNIVELVHFAQAFDLI